MTNQPYEVQTMRFDATLYPNLGVTVQKFRCKARHGLADLTRDERREYGAAVEKAILAKQRSALNAYCRNPYPNRTGREWRDLYDAAMQQKRNR